MPARTIAACLLIIFACIQPTNADVIITFTEQSGSVEADWNGSMDLAGLLFDPPGAPQMGLISSGNGLFRGFDTAGSVVREYRNVFSPLGQVFGSDSTLTNATAFSGTAFGFEGQGGRLYVDSVYVSNTPLSGSLSFAGESYASLGLTPTTTPYEWTLTNGEKFFVSINSSAAVPEPSTFAVLAIAAFGIFGLRQRRKMQTHQSTDA